jgi:nitroreductase
VSRPAAIDMILTRRSARKFSEEAVTDEDLSVILEAGLRAPSSKNSQPWYLAVATGQAKEDICRWVEENPERARTKPGKLLIDEPFARVRDSTRYSLRYVRAAPVLILIFNRAPFTGSKKRMEDEIRSGRSAAFENEYVGVGACMENVLLAAHALGLGAIPVMDIMPAAPLFRQRFEIDYDLVIGVVVGHPRQGSPSTLSPRPLECERFVKYLK